MSDYQHTLNDEVQEGVTLQGIEVWRPAVAYPIIGGLFRPYRCGCGKRFRNKQEYDEHYIYWAIWQNESGYIPRLLNAKNKAVGSPQSNKVTSERNAPAQASTPQQRN
jgi:hypothetical protein